MKFLLLLAAALAAITPAMPAPAVAQEETEATSRFSVEVVGQGPDVILIPGLMSPRSVWDAQVEALQGDFRLHLVEVAGFGTTPAGPSTKIPSWRSASLVEYISRSDSSGIR